MAPDRMLLADGEFAYHFSAGTSIARRQAIVDQHNINLLLGISDEEYNESILNSPLVS